MKKVSASDIETALRSVGIKGDELVMIHSGVQFLGLPEKGFETYLSGLNSVFGSSATIVVPTFYNEYPKTRKFDPVTTPGSGGGVLSERLRLQPGFVRSNHPVQSIAARGPFATDIVNRSTPSAFEAGSSFERILELSGKLIFLGIHEPAATIVHYCEQTMQVPYRRWLDLPGEVFLNGHFEPLICRMYVRIPEVDARLDFMLVKEWLNERNLLKTAPLNYGFLSVCDIHSYVEIINEKLSEDPWALVGNKDEAKKRWLANNYPKT